MLDRIVTQLFILFHPFQTQIYCLSFDLLDFNLIMIEDNLDHFKYEYFCIHLQVQKLSKNEVLMVNIGSLATGGRVVAVKADLAKIALAQPVCTEIGEKIALSRRVEKHWR